MSDADTSVGDWVRIAAVADLDPEFPILVRIGDAELVVGESEGAPFALHNICSHAFARLSDGYVEGTEIFCPLHQGSFDVRTGEARAAPCVEAIAAYPLKVEGGDVFVNAALLAGQAAVI